MRNFTELKAALEQIANILIDNDPDPDQLSRLIKLLEIEDKLEAIKNELVFLEMTDMPNSDDLKVVMVQCGQYISQANLKKWACEEGRPALSQEKSNLSSKTFSFSDMFALLRESPASEVRYSQVQPSPS